MHTFKDHLLLERVGKSDIIDLFLIMSMPEPSSKDGKFIVDEVVKHSRRNILNELESIILTELAYIISGLNAKVSFYEEEIDSYRKAMEVLFKKSFKHKDIDDITNIVQKLSRGISDNEEATLKKVNKALKTNFTFKDVMQVFEMPIWEPSYGGKPWSDFTSMVSHLSQIKEPAAFLKSFERLVDVVHNTGTFLNKFKGYGEGWMTFLLDLKQLTHNVRDLFPYTSKDVRKLLNDPNWRVWTHQATRNVESDSLSSLIQKGLAAGINLPEYFDNLTQHYGERRIMDEVKKVINHMPRSEKQNFYSNLIVAYPQTPFLKKIRADIKSSNPAVK